MKNLLLNKPANVTNALLSFTKTTTLKTSTLPNTTRNTISPLTGPFNRYQINRFWTNFNEGLYNRICEIKMQEL